MICPALELFTSKGMAISAMNGTLLLLPLRVFRRGSCSKGLFDLSSAKVSRIDPHSHITVGHNNCPTCCHTFLMEGLLLAQISKITRSQSVGNSRLLVIAMGALPGFISCIQAQVTPGCFWINWKRPLSTPVLPTTIRKLRQIKQHRKNTMESHGDLVPKGTGLVTAEDRLTAALYACKVKQAYQEAFHLSVHWDPSNYDTETLVSIIFSTQAGDEGSGGVAAYLPIQNMKPVAKKEVSPDIQALGAKKQLTRIEGFNELKALSHSLIAVGMPFEEFFLENVCWQKLGEFESRVFENGLWRVVNSRTGARKLQLPKNFDISKTPLLVSLSDQGGIRGGSTELGLIT